jgi:hypothetical protein
MAQTPKQNLITIQMNCVVPRNAQGYVNDLASLNATPEFIADRLTQLEKYCPELVAKYREAATK